MSRTPPDNPAGLFQPVETYDLTERSRLIDVIRKAPKIIEKRCPWSHRDTTRHALQELDNPADYTPPCRQPPA